MTIQHLTHSFCGKPVVPAYWENLLEDVNEKGAPQVVKMLQSLYGWPDCDVRIIKQETTN